MKMYQISFTLTTADVFYTFTAISLLSIQIILVMINKQLKNLSLMVVASTGRLHKIFATEQSKRSEVLLRKIQLVQYDNGRRGNCLLPLQSHFFKAIGVSNYNYLHFHYATDEFKRLWLAVVCSIFSTDFLAKATSEISDDNLHKVFMQGNGVSDLHPLVYREIIRASMNSNGKGVIAWVREELQHIGVLWATDSHFRERVDHIVNKLLKDEDQWLYSFPIESVDEVSEWEQYISGITGKTFSLQLLPGNNS